MQAIGVFVAGDAAQFIAFGGDFAVGVVGKRTGCTAGQGDLCEAIGGVPLVVGDRAGFFLTGDLPAQVRRNGICAGRHRAGCSSSSWPRLFQPS